MGNKNERKSPKDKMIESIKVAEAATIKEQDIYREVIDMDMKSTLTGPLDPEITIQGWEAVLSLMKDCNYPPDYETRHKLLNISYDETLNRKKLEKIKDIDIRHYTYFLNETIEQTQRLHSMAKFIERIGHLNGFGNAVFGMWSAGSSMRILQAEALEMGRNLDCEEIGVFAAALNIMGEGLLEVWGDPVGELEMKKNIDTLADVLT